MFDLTFLPRGREFYSNFLESVKFMPYVPLSPFNLKRSTVDESQAENRPVPMQEAAKR